MHVLSLLPLFSVFVTTLGTPPPDSITIKDHKAGKGYAAQKGDVVTVTYKGTLADGKVFDSSDKKPPFALVLGLGQVIPGWDEGLKGVKVGMVRELVIPPSKAYGAQGYGTVPANATLTFVLEVLRIDKKGVAQKTEITDLAPGIGVGAKEGNTVEVLYRGLFLNGVEFVKGTFPLVLGAHGVIPGFEQAVSGLQVGGKRKVVIPYSQGYGAQGQPPVIPRYSTLVFEIEVKTIKG